MPAVTADAVVVGAGIAGAAAADALAGRGLRVALVEGEDTPGRHTTGRSAAVWLPTYGPEPVQRLTAAGRHALAQPDPRSPGTAPVLRPRPTLTVAAPGDEHEVDTHLATARSAGVALTPLDPGEAVRLFPALRREHVAAATVDHGSADIDVDALHQRFLRSLRSRGGTVTVSAPVVGLTRRATGWEVATPVVTVSAGVVVDAAGAWGDAVAALAGIAPVGLRPLRRTAFLVDAPSGSAGWPLVNDAAEAWYAKPDAGLMLVSPADETPSPPVDARADPEDVARAIDVVNERTTLAVRAVRRAWAGLRTFAPDRVPVLGPDPEVASFVWCVGQGGYGIQTAPAAGELVAALVAGGEPPVPPATVAALAPARLRAGSGATGDATALTRASSRDAAPRPRR